MIHTRLAAIMPENEPMRWRDRIARFLFRHRLRGAVRFHQFACKGAPITALTKHGIILELNPYEYVDGFVLRCGYYEEEVLKAVTKGIRPGDVFWDIGSNLGLHALTMAKRGKEIRVYAFEPNPALAKAIRRGVQANAVRVEVMECALDNQDGTASFYLYEGNNGRSGLHNWEHTAGLKTIEVATARAMSLVTDQRVAPPNVIKLDVEGNELRVLQGMEGILDDRRLRTVVFEDAKDEDSEVKRLLRSKGFTIARLERLEDTHHDLENYTAQR